MFFCCSYLCYASHPNKMRPTWISRLLEGACPQLEDSPTFLPKYIQNNIWLGSTKLLSRLLFDFHSLLVSSSQRASRLSWLFRLFQLFVALPQVCSAVACFFLQSVCVQNFRVVNIISVCGPTHVQLLELVF